MKVVASWVILIVIIWWASTAFGDVGKYEGENADYWYDAYYEEVGKVEDLESQLSDYQDALSEANSNIETVNNNIDDAKWYAWESYDEMGEALDSLDPVDTISEP